MNRQKTRRTRRANARIHRFMALLALLAAVSAGSADAHDAPTPAPAAFDARFTGDTLRVDLFHTVGLQEDIFSVDRMVHDGPWAGSRSRVLDDTGLGKLRLEVKDAGSGVLIYSRGFATLSGEWETTAAARSARRTFHESLRLPWPRKPATLKVLKRSDHGDFVDTWAVDIDPASRFVNAAAAGTEATVSALQENGPPAKKVDLALVADGYTAKQMTKFRRDARRLVESLFSLEPFASRRSDFNIWLVEKPTAVPGVNRPHVGEFRRNPLGTTYNVFDSERYMLTLDNRALRDLLSGVPYEFVEILVNEKQYGGGGIYRAQATTAVDTAFSEYIFVHEFGHHFAALADEYYTSPVAYETGGETHPEPWEPNVTALHNPSDLKWRDLVAKGTPLPTPWDKTGYETHAREIRRRRQALIDARAPEDEFDILFREQRAVETKMLGSMEYAGAVGAFEGAAYEARGLYRPTIDCIMFSRNPVGFCPVCRRGISRVIDLYAE